MLRFKPEVRIGVLTAPLSEILYHASVWSVRTSVDVEINSVNEHVAGRLVNSLHYVDLAADLDTVGDRTPDTEALRDYLTQVLPPGYDVVYEVKGDARWIHVEWDTRRRQPA
jgi:hypothetical protein